MAKEKNKPVPVRFNLKLLEVLKEEEKIDTPQQALNFLTSFWENNRPAKGDFLGGGGQPVAAASAGVPGSAAATAPTTAIVPSSKKKTGQIKEGSSAEPPSGLSGIDLSIWKAEQKEKNKT
jgi:hypothetical protein